MSSGDIEAARELVVVLETGDQIQLAMARGLLEDAGIPFYIRGRIATLIQDIDPFLHKVIGIQVPRDREADARDALEPVLHPKPYPID